MPDVMRAARWPAARMRLKRLGVRGRVIILQPHFCVIDDRREDVIELVSDRCRQRPHRTEAVGLNQLFLQARDLRFEVCRRLLSLRGDIHDVVAVASSRTF